MLEIDKKLEYPSRSLRAYNGKLLFGPVGERLFCDCLDKLPGFCGHIDFIHKMNIDQLFTVKCSTAPDYITAKTVWYPSRLTFSFEDENVRLEEIKTIRNNDIAFVTQTWENLSEEAVTLTLVCEPTGCEVCREEGYVWMQMPQERNTIQVGAAVAWDAAEEDFITLQPGVRVSFTVVAATGNILLESKEDIVSRLKEFIGREMQPEEYVAENEEEMNQFFSQLPEFESSDPVLNKTWYYRWYILRHCTSKPQQGYLKHTTVYEGRGHKTGKMEPMKVTGWEFSRLICLSTPLQLTDYKWCPDKELLHDIIRGVLSTADENGIVQSTFVHHKGSPFANFLIWAIYQNYLLDGDVEFVKEILPLAKKCVDGNTKVYGSANDNLQIEVKHQRTGKEFQPSYWYWSDYPKENAKHLATPLKRMDTSVYHYLNVKGLYKMMEAAGDAQAAEYKEFADTLARQINDKAWDEETGFYYDLHHETDEKAMVKNIVGFYPYWAEFADEDKLKGIEHLFDKELFNLGELFATTAPDCPGYSPIGAWRGSLHSRDGCMWNGPSWPYTNGIMLDMIGKQSKAQNHKYDEQFAHFLRDYSLEHYRMHDIGMPYLVEQYHAITGEPISDEPDYNHSFYLELLISHVAGLKVEEDKVVIDPLHIGLDYFRLGNVKVRNKSITIAYSKKDRPEKGIQKGFTVTVDGKAEVVKEDLCKVEIAL